MIKKNNKTVGFIYKNNQNIDKVYKGTDLVFEQGYTREQTGVPPITTTYQAIGKNLKDYKIYGNSIQGKLPDTYQEVEYIENTGTQYIDTEFTPDYTKNIEIKIVFEPTVSDSRYCLLSNFAVADNLSLEVKENKGRVYSSIGNSDSTIGTVSTSTKNTYLFNYDVINKKYTLTVNNQSVNGNINATGISGGSMLVFVDQSKRFYLFRNSIKIYNLKISENGILIRNFIPCYRKSDNEIGLYDIVNNVFYTNQGTEEFLKGSNAPTPSVPIEIESVGDLITDTNDINYGKYKIPVIVGNTTTNIYLDEPLRKIGDYSDYIDFRNQKEFRNVIVNDDTGTQTIENSYTGTTDSSGTSISLPNIPTIKGTTIFEIDTEIQPSSMYIKYKSK